MVFRLISDHLVRPIVDGYRFRPTVNWWLLWSIAGAYGLRSLVDNWFRPVVVYCILQLVVYWFRRVVACVNHRFLQCSFTYFGWLQMTDFGYIVFQLFFLLLSQIHRLIIFLDCSPTDYRVWLFRCNIFCFVDFGTS